MGLPPENTSEHFDGPQQGDFVHRKSSKAFYFLALKLLLSVALMWGLIEWGEVDPVAAIDVISHPFMAMLACLMVLAGFVLGAVRWRLLLRVLQVDLPFRALFRVVVLSLLAGMILPGTISGETVRVGYVVLGRRGQRSPLMASIVFDRVVGLFGLSILGAIVVVPVLDRVLNSPELSVLATGMVVLPLVIVAVVGLSWSVGGIFAKRLSAYRGESFRWLICSLARFLEVIYVYREARSAILGCSILSILIHTFGIGALVLLSTEMLGGSLRPSEAAFVTPAALLSNLIPITPGGLGIGEAAFGGISAWITGNTAIAFGSILLAFRVIALLALAVALMWIFAVDYFLPSPASVESEQTHPGPKSS